MTQGKKTKVMTKTSSVVSGKFVPNQVMDYCRLHKLKLEKHTSKGFIASHLVDVRAGMQTDPITLRTISAPIKKIGKKRVYTDFICYVDGDVVGNGKLPKNKQL